MRDVAATAAGQDHNRSLDCCCSKLGNTESQGSLL